jgi:Flp pilus assembly protein CpaB
MEMEYKDNNRRGRYIIVLGVVLALVAGGGAFFVVNQAQQTAGAANQPKVTVVVALRVIPARKPIEVGDVTTREIVLDETNAQGVFDSPKQVIGRILAVPALQGQMVTSNMMASTNTGGQFSIIAPGESVGPDSPAWRAVSITVPEDRAVGGLVAPNAVVDVFVTATVVVPQSVLDQGRFYTDKSTKIAYQNVVVLAKAANFYVIKVTEPVAEEIAQLMASGTASFSMALRPDADTRLVDVSVLGETTNLIIERYGLPIPQTYPAGKGVTTGPAPTPFPTPPPGSSASPAPSAAP